MDKIKVLKMGIPGWTITAAVKALGENGGSGHYLRGSQIVIDVDKILQKVPHVHLLIENIVMENGILAIKVAAINADVKAMQAEAKKEKDYEESGRRL